jgi:hypothetical protein
VSPFRFDRPCNTEAVVDDIDLCECIGIRCAQSTRSNRGHIRVGLRQGALVGTCARCSILAAAKSKKRMMFPGFPMPNLFQQLADTAKQLGVEINLNYSFLQQQKPDNHGRINCFGFGGRAAHQATRRRHCA